MIYNIVAYIPIEANSREEAEELAKPFIENPRNPNLLRLPLGISSLSQKINQAKTKSVYCSARFCYNYFVENESGLCDTHNDPAALNWFVHIDGYGAAASQDGDGKVPCQLYTKDKAEELMVGWSNNGFRKGYEVRIWNAPR